MISPVSAVVHVMHNFPCWGPRNPNFPQDNERYRIRVKSAHIPDKEL